MCESAGGAGPPMSLCLKQPKKSNLADVCQIFAGISVLLLAMCSAHNRAPPFGMLGSSWGALPPLLKFAYVENSLLSVCVIEF